MGADIVTVTLSGFAPNVSVGWAQCLDVDLTPPNFNCSFPFGLGTTDATGTVSSTVRLARFIYVPNARRWVDCTDPLEHCVIGAAEDFDIAGTWTVASLGFAPPPAPPATRGTVTITPSTVPAPGVQVSVTGAGFRPSSPVQVFQCVPTATDPSGCNGPTASITTDGSGGFTVPVKVVGSVQPLGGPVTPCFVTSGSCVVAAAEEVDFPGTVASAPIGLIPTILPGGATVAEGSGPPVLNVPVSLSWPSDQTVTVQWTTIFRTDWSDLAAHPDEDYVPASGEVTFAPGETEKTVPITIVDDAVAEPGELLAVSFRNPVNAQMGGFWGIGFGGITDDD
jgi:hypothetical protein